MARTMNNLQIVAAAIVLLAVTVGAQLTPTPTVDCTQAQTMTFNATQFSGDWYEVARNPAPAQSVSCVEIDVDYMPSMNMLNISTTYASDPSFLYVNITVTANVSLAATTPNTVGYNITYMFDSTPSTTTVTYKLLDTDYNNYALVCGYTNVSDPTTSFGIVLTRQSLPNVTVLNGYEMMAFNQYSNFMNGSMATITQGPACYASGAATMLPFLSAIVAALYAALKLIN